MSTRFDELVMPQKYGLISHGISMIVRGNLLQVDDVARTIDSILDDDETVAINLSLFLRYLREG